MNSYWLKELAKFKGWTVIDAATDPEGEFFGLVLCKRGEKTKILWLLCDEEGNGPGAFDVTDL